MVCGLTATHYEGVPVRCARFKARPSFIFAGSCRRRSMVTDGGSGTSGGRAASTPTIEGYWPRPSAFHAGHNPSWGETCERPALPPFAGASRWLLLLLSPLLSAAVGTTDAPTVQGMACVPDRAGSRHVQETWMVPPILRKTPWNGTGLSVVSVIEHR